MKQQRNKTSKKVQLDLKLLGPELAQAVRHACCKTAKNWEAARAKEAYLTLSKSNKFKKLILKEFKDGRTVCLHKLIVPEQDPSKQWSAKAQYWLVEGPPKRSSSCISTGRSFYLSSKPGELYFSRSAKSGPVWWLVADRNIHYGKSMCSFCKNVFNCTLSDEIKGNFSLAR